MESKKDSFSVIAKSLAVQPALRSEVSKRKKYLNIFEGFVGRFIFGTTPYDGIYTDEVVNCEVIVICGKRSGISCFSLMHVSGASNLQSLIAKEQQWLEKGSQIVIIAHQKEFAQGAICLERDISETTDEKNLRFVNLPKDRNAVMVTLDAEGNLNFEFDHTHHKKHTIELINHPAAVKIYARYLFITSIASLYAHMATLALEEKASSISAYTEKFESVMRDYRPKEKLLLLYNGTNFNSIELSFTKKVKMMYAHLLGKTKSKPRDAEEVFGLIQERLKIDLQIIGKDISSFWKDKEIGLAISATTAAIWFCVLTGNIALLEQSSQLPVFMSANIARRYAGREEIPFKKREEKVPRFSFIPSRSFPLKPLALLFCVAYWLLEDKEHSTFFNVMKAGAATTAIFVIFMLLKNKQRSATFETPVSTDEENSVSFSPKTL